LDLIKNVTEKYSSFSRMQKKVADYIAENMQTIAFKTLEDVASLVGVSTTTIIRFARCLGYSGYSQMQQDIRDSIKEKVSLPERLDTTIKKIHKDRLLIDAYKREISNLSETLKNITPEELERAINLIVGAENVYVLGMRSTFAIAHYTSIYLAQVKKNVRLIQGVGGMYPEEVVNFKKGDVCIAFLFPRYQRTVANLLSWAKNHGVKVVLFTSGTYSNIRHLGDIFIPCVIKSLSVKDSLIPAMFLAQYLVAAIAVSDYNQSKEVLTNMEEILGQGYYLGL